MWRMLLGRATDELRAEYRDIRADDEAGSVHWEAYYDFTGHPVHNVIDATFSFTNGLISRHVDDFDLPRWAGQALGLPGRLLGRTSFLHSRVRTTARRQLADFRAKRA